MGWKKGKGRNPSTWYDEKERPWAGFHLLDCAWPWVRRLGTAGAALHTACMHHLHLLASSSAELPPLQANEFQALVTPGGAVTHDGLSIAVYGSVSVPYPVFNEASQREFP